MRRRTGFTLVELLVAMALIIFIMTILSQAFGEASNTFRNLKAVNDMAEKLRSVTGILRRDLAADHFEGRKRLSDPNFWKDGPPQEGFFRIWQGAPSFLEGSDNFLKTFSGTNLPSFRASRHVLHFSVKLRGNQRSDYFSASVPMQPGPPPGPSPLMTNFGPTDAHYEDTPNIYNYQWAEVGYFLRPAIDPNTGVQDVAVDAATGSSTLLFSLFRRQCVAVPDNLPVANQVPFGLGSSYLEVSTQPNRPVGNPPMLYFNSPRDLTMPARRFGMEPNPASPADPLNPLQPAGVLYYTPPVTQPVGPPYDYPTMGESNPLFAGSDLMLSNVVSFDVRILADPRVFPVLPGLVRPSDFLDVQTLATSTFNTSPPVQVFNNNNPAFPRNTPPFLTQWVFDTWSSATDDNYDYSNWAQPGNSDPTRATSIPLWNGTPGFNSGPVIKAIQVTIRIWDQKTQQTRQVSIIQAM